MKQGSAQWHAALPPLGAPTLSISPSLLSTLSAKAALLHQNDTRSSSPPGSEASFLSKIIHSGTLSDRLSALTLLVQSSPLHNTKPLESLKAMAERGKGKGGREESLKALRCIVDWWVGGGAPDRKLKSFRDQPLLHPDVTDEYLLLWYFEDWLKKYFFSILQILETLSLDPLPYIRTQTISLIFTLLRDRPEQEQNLLRLLVNKLGDTDKSLCSRASYHILQLLQTHPSMKTVVVREIMALVLKPPVAASVPQRGEKDKKGGNAHAKYYAAVTLNQIVLTPSDRGVAVTLLDVYFQMFQEILGEKEEGEGEKGGESEDGEVVDVKMDKKGRVLDHKKGKKGHKASNHFKGSAGFMEVGDSSSKLISAVLTGINRALPFANIGADDSVLNKHIDTLFFITHTSTFNISLQALLLIQQIAASLSSSNKSHPSSTVTKSIADRYYRALYASLHDTRLASSSKQAMYLNLFFKSVKADENHERIKALVRRFTQVLVSGGGGATEFVAGGLYLLGELFSCVPGLKAILNNPSSKDLLDQEKYDPRKRDPQYVHAATSPLWELTPLLHHYHPAIALHARQLLSSQLLTASPDLSQNTLSHFLDRFVYKNPKKLKPKEGEPEGSRRLGKGPSAMQPAASGVEGIKLIRGEVGYIGEEVVNEKAFLRKRRENVPVDQVFFHDYFTRKYQKERSLKEVKEGGSVKSDRDGGDDDDDEGKESGSDWDEDDAREAEIWKVMSATMPKVDEDDDLMDDDSEDGEAPFGGDRDSGSDHENDQDSDDSTEIVSLVEGSDDEDLIPLDPEELIEYDGSDAGDSGTDGAVDREEEWDGIGKRKRAKENENENGRKKKRSLPMFASYEDYARLIEQGPEDDI